VLVGIGALDGHLLMRLHRGDELATVDLPVVHELVHRLDYPTRVQDVGTELTGISTLKDVLDPPKPIPGRADQCQIDFEMIAQYSPTHSAEPRTDDRAYSPRHRVWIAFHTEA
jgi:hypothetical protein